MGTARAASARLLACQCVVCGVSSSHWWKYRSSNHRIVSRTSGCFTSAAPFGAVLCSSSSSSSAGRAASSVAARDHFIFENTAPLKADYSIKKTLGKGSFSSVYLAVHKRTGIQRAVKQITKARTNKEQFTAEVRALISLDHPHIVKVLEYFEDEANYYVVMELCTGKDLFDWVMDSMARSSNRCLGEEEASIIMRQCLKATIGCHAKGFVHRDLKLENFVLVGKDQTVKLIDFGLAKRLRDSSKPGEEAAGTLPYLAPEVLKPNQVAGCPVDVWSLGVMLFMMLTGEPLLTEGSEILELKDEQAVAKRLRACVAFRRASAEVKDLVSRMLEWNEDKRISAEDALQHPFIRSRRHAGVESHFPWDFDKQLPEKMVRFAQAPLLRQTGLLCLVHLAAASRLPDGLYHELMTARHIFRSLDEFGTGQVTPATLKQRLVEEGIEVAADFDDVCWRCQRSSSTSDGGDGQHIDYGVLVACLMMDCHWPDFLLREAFNILDRSRNGVIEANDLVMLSNNEHSEDFEAIISEVDSAGDGYVNYDTFLHVLGVDRVKSAALPSYRSAMMWVRNL